MLYILFPENYHEGFNYPLISDNYQYSQPAYHDERATPDVQQLGNGIPGQGWLGERVRFEQPPHGSPILHEYIPEIARASNGRRTSETQISDTSPVYRGLMSTPLGVNIQMHFLPPPAAEQDIYTGTDYNDQFGDNRGSGSRVRRRDSSSGSSGRRRRTQRRPPPPQLQNIQNAYQQDIEGPGFTSQYYLPSSPPAAYEQQIDSQPLSRQPSWTPVVDGAPTWYEPYVDPGFVHGQPTAPIEQLPQEPHQQWPTEVHGDPGGWQPPPPPPPPSQSLNTSETQNRPRSNAFRRRGHRRSGHQGSGGSWH